MKELSRKEYNEHMKCDNEFVIEHSKGTIIVKSSFFRKYQKKFMKALSDVTIFKMVERKVND